MGCWGYRLFECDDDIDIACELSCAFGEVEANEIELSSMINQTDMLAGREMRDLYKTAEYQAELNSIVTRVREQLDSGLGDKLFEKYRAEENEWHGKYRVIIIGALMMRAGAKIKNEDFQHLRELVPTIQCNNGYTLPLADSGCFRYPGKVQFLAALDNYATGTPRNYQEPSCFHCGKVDVDLGKVPMKCSRCQRAWYCDRVSHTFPTAPILNR